MIGNQKKFLAACFDKAVKAVQPSECIAKFIPDPPQGRTVVIGAGKASAAMARSFEQYFEGPLTGGEPPCRGGGCSAFPGSFSVFRCGWR